MFIGLLLGANLSHRSHLVPVALIGALVSIAWSAGVAVSVDAPFLDGTALAAPNDAFGALVGIVLGTVIRAAIGLVRAPHLPPTG
jgi:hypothetical protein